MYPKSIPLLPSSGLVRTESEDWYEQSLAGLRSCWPTATNPRWQASAWRPDARPGDLDDKDQVIRPAILWNDGRTTEETDYLNQVIGKEKLSAYTANIAFAGFTAPKILWVKNKEPENFAKIKKIMLPKDYLAYRLTGAFCTDVSDASGMLLFDVKNRCWSKR